MVTGVSIKDYAAVLMDAAREHKGEFDVKDVDYSINRLITAAEMYEHAADILLREVRKLERNAENALNIIEGKG